MSSADSSIEFAKTESFATNVEQVIRHDGYGEILRDMYSRHLQGEDIQGEVNTFLDFNTDMRDTVMCVADYADNNETGVTQAVEELLTIATDEGHLDQDTAKEFSEVFANANWIVPGAQSYRQHHRDVDIWTDQDVTVRVDPQDPYYFIADWTADNGFDNLWEFTAPLSVIINRLAVTTGHFEHQLAEVIDQMGGAAGLDPDAVDEVVSQAEDLNQITDQLLNTARELKGYTHDSVELNDYSDFQEVIEGMDVTGVDIDEDLPDFS